MTINSIDCRLLLGYQSAREFLNVQTEFTSGLIRFDDYGRSKDVIKSTFSVRFDASDYINYKSLLTSLDDESQIDVILQENEKILGSEVNYFIGSNITLDLISAQGSRESMSFFKIDFEVVAKNYPNNTNTKATDLNALNIQASYGSSINVNRTEVLALNTIKTYSFDNDRATMSLAFEVDRNTASSVKRLITEDIRLTEFDIPNTWVDALSFFSGVSVQKLQILPILIESFDNNILSTLTIDFRAIE